MAGNFWGPASIARPEKPSSGGESSVAFQLNADSQQSSLAFATQAPSQNEAGRDSTELPSSVETSGEPNVHSQHAIPSSIIQQSRAVADVIQDVAPLSIRSCSPSSFERSADGGVRVEISPPKYGRLPYSTSKTVLIYDSRMRLHADPSPDAAEDAHPEQPRRIVEIYQELINAGLAPDPRLGGVSDAHMMHHLPLRAATKEEITWIHDKDYVDDLETLAGADLDELKGRTAAGESIYFNNNSWLCATLAAGGAIVATEAVARREAKNGVAIIRPPGHHAEHKEATGFCFFNNVCIAARAAQNYHGQRKILILDWDVHHGNGVQRAFYTDPNVLYISLHVYRDARFYPHSDFADHLHCGDGAGTGMTVNIPWEAAGMTDADYIMAFQQVVMPIAIEFDPDMVLISAGFDAAEGDPLGECHLSPAAYGHMTHMLMQLAGGKVVACLEGGYNLRSIAVSALAMTRTLMGEPPERLNELAPTPSAVNTVQKVIRTQSRFWKSLYPKDLNLRRKDELGAQRLHDIIREWQGQVLREQHKMGELLILRDQISKSFKNQVLATDNFEQERPLVVIFHDPPEAEGYADPFSSKLELHNTFLTYTDWAVGQGFAVIDANIPRHITGQTDETGFVAADAERKRSEHARDLAFYLWDNYVDLDTCSHTFLIGVGDAYSGLTDLLSRHPSAASKIDFTVSFIAENPLRSVQSSTNEGLSNMYYQRSAVFVSPNHLCWDPTQSKRLKKRFGKVIKSTATDLQAMMKEHFGEVTKAILDKTQEWREMNQDLMPDQPGANGDAFAHVDGSY